MKKPGIYLVINICLISVIVSGCFDHSQRAKYSPNAAVVARESWPPFFNDVERVVRSKGLNTDSFRVHEVASDEFFF